MAEFHLVPRSVPIKVAAYQLDVHEDTIRRWAKAGRIQVIRVGVKLLRVPCSEIDRLLHTNTSA